jgi:hypothetical protein
MWLIGNSTIGLESALSKKVHAYDDFLPTWVKKVNGRTPIFNKLQNDGDEMDDEIFSHLLS